MSNERTCHASSSLRLFLCAFFIVAKGVLLLLLPAGVYQIYFWGANTAWGLRCCCCRPREQNSAHRKLPVLQIKARCREKQVPS